MHHPTFFLLALPADKTAILSSNAPDACFSLFFSLIPNFRILINLHFIYKLTLNC